MTVLDLIAERESIFGPADSDTVVRDSYATSFLLPIPVNFALIYFWVISIPLYKFVTLCGDSRWFETEHASVLHLMKQVSMRGPKQLAHFFHALKEILCLFRAVILPSLLLKNFFSMLIKGSLGEPRQIVRDDRPVQKPMSVCPGYYHAIGVDRHRGSVQLLVVFLAENHSDVADYRDAATFQVFVIFPLVDHVVF